MEKFKNPRTTHFLIFSQLFFMIAQVCFAHNGNSVSLIGRDGALYYRICVLHSIPINYYIRDTFKNVIIRLSGHAYGQDRSPLVRKALDQWSLATTMPGHQPTCLFNEINQQENADLVFEARYSNFPDEIRYNMDIDSYRLRVGDSAVNTITILPQRMSALLQRNRRFFSDISDQIYIDNYLMARILHLTGHALGLDHPGLEESGDVLPFSLSRQDRTFFQTGDDLSENEWMRPHIMSSDTFAYLQELQQYLGRPVVSDDVRAAEVENQAIRFYLVHAWQCVAPDAYSARAVSPRSSSPPRCLFHPPGFGLPALFNLLLH